MSIVGEILEELWNTELKYKGMQVNIFGIPQFKQYPPKTIQVTINRLKRKGLIEKNLTKIFLSKDGKKYIKKKINSLKQFNKPKDISNNRNLLVMFDIPNERKAEREWFRWHLKKFNYILVQKSVWVGPSPLPKDFLDYVEKIKLKKCIKTFKLAKSYEKYQK
jgi:DNA-binding transcriptional regulator PaaX